MDGVNDTAEIVKDFLIESLEGLDQVDQDLMDLEREGPDAERIGRIFRCVHTLKGTCGFLGFSVLESVTHVGENLLVELRDGTTAVTPEVVDALLALVDAIRLMLNLIEQTGTDGEPTFQALIARLTALTREHADAHGAAAAAAASMPTSETAEGTHPPIGELMVARGDVTASDVSAALHEQEQSDALLGEILVQRGYTSPAAVREALDVQENNVDIKSSAIADSSIRVDVALLDKLMNLVGELVLARNQLLQSDGRFDAAAHTGTTQRLNLITTELQEGVMKTRMQPIGNVWNKFPRVVRDLAQACGKQVVLEMAGAETELDKTIIEAIKDPLTHIVRNAVDHGVETPIERVRHGKSPEGRLIIRAFHEGGKVNIEIRDDGRGIDPEAIKAKAISMGAVRADAAAQMSDREALHLIFHAGLSTAKTVTNVSGRGVGMDVVRTNIERIGGSLEVSSVVGNGTTLRIKIPLTLAIIPGLIVTTGGSRFVIPQVNLLELVRLEGADAVARIERVYDAPVLRLRGRLLPLITLTEALGVDRHCGKSTDDVTNIVVVQAEGTAFGVIVDAINDTEEIVVKPLSVQLKGIAAFAGATIMGDGRVALILDVHGLAQSRGLLARGDRQAESRVDQRAQEAHSQQLLLVAVDDTHIVAFPLDAIARLEEIRSSQIEWTGSQEVVQYRKRILPVVRLDEMLEGIIPSLGRAESMPLIVYEDSTRSIGFAVQRILDVVAVEMDTVGASGTGMVARTAVIQGRVTDVLDVQSLLATLDGRLPASLDTVHHDEAAHA
ncbi:chemotaxis protein CheA [Gemmatimonas groenlandica]|uniref:histidine kinase n=1 Tax=Gemmatimonas groenlandica TaxID=2732249 RepID=A0A6M4IUX0_9BACT|nr:chemotaxis protein CheA [Gemmatimonas groenlandica]QJR35961.1 chemotaxis protein CheA [Gemmatimonas groenlandica]